MIRYILTILFAFTNLNAQQYNSILSPVPFGASLNNVYKNLTSTQKIKVWIYLNDKGTIQKQSTLIAKSLLSDKALVRRSKVRGLNKLVDERDLPVSDNYLQTLRSNVSVIRQTSKWFNAVSALVTKEQINNLRQLPFIKEIDVLATYGKVKPEISQTINENIPASKFADDLDYGPSRTQLNQINVIPLHNRGIHGQGVTICVLDNGFRLLSHEALASMNIVAGYDFVDNDPDPAPPVGSSYGAHGINTLSTIGGYKPGTLIGPAYQANYILARTENDASETPIEEDNWVRAIEWAESLGVDVTSTSLGYLTYDAPYTSWTWQNMDGNTTMITKAANRADSLGILVVNSAGNEATDGTPNTLIAPADGFNVVTAGAVDSFGVRTYFSSYGPTYDGRIKPDVMAMGAAVVVASAFNTTQYQRSQGTSFSCPLTAGAAALILSAHPSLTNHQVRNAMRMTASRSNNPDNYYGWGILNTTAAVDYFMPNAVHTPVTGVQPNSPIAFIATINSGIPLNLDSCKVIYGINGSFTDSVPLTPTGNPDEYSASIPALGLGNTVNYYIIIQNVDKDIVKLPANSPDDFYSYVIGGTAMTIDLISGWNLVSIPLTLSDYKSSFVFPDANSGIYAFKDGYSNPAKLQNGKGYWVKYGSDQSVELYGFSRLIDTVEVMIGWNLIGSLSTPITVSAIIQEPDNIIASSIYYYNNNRYEITNSLEPGKGYWIKVNQDGKLILNSSGKK
jgi:subtilisin family serine protease